LYIWGRNEAGQLGCTTEFDIKLPRLFTFFKNIPLEDIKVGWGFNVALTKSGEVYSWGFNMNGELGQSVFTNIRTPTIIQYFNNIFIAKIFCGQHQCFFVTKTKEIYACGDNDRGQLGNGFTTKIDTPELITTLLGYTITEISFGNTTYAKTDSGVILEWGEDLYNPHWHKQTLVPRVYTFFNQEVKLVSNFSQRYALTNSNKLYVWGKHNLDGRFGIGHTNNVSTPELVKFFKDKKIKQICLGLDFTVVIVSI